MPKPRIITATRTCLAAVILACPLTQWALAADWPQWRGPKRDGVWSEEDIIQNFDGPQLPVRWRAKVANGYSAPTVADGRVYLTDRLTEPNHVERVHCFDAMTGEPIWSRTYVCKYKNVGYPNGPRASVTINGNRAYSLGTMGHLLCFDAATGHVRWSKTPGKDYELKVPTWGIAAAPLIEKNLLIVQIGGKQDACLMAFDKVSGTPKWRALSDGASYSAPIVIDQAGKRVLVCLTAERLVGLDPDSGKIYWQLPFGPTRNIAQNVATPVLYKNFLFVSSFFDGSMLVRLNNDKPAADVVWRRKGENERRTDSLHCCISTPILDGDHIYGVDSYGQLRCLDLLTGDRVWESLDAVPRARWANIHMVRHQNRIWMFNERGQLIISELSPKGFHEISRTQLIEPTQGQLSKRGGVCWAHPAFAYKHVYVRNDQELVCADLSADN